MLVTEELGGTMAFGTFMLLFLLLYCTSILKLVPIL
jgi:hypothetical protein